MAISFSINPAAPSCPTQLDGTRLETSVPPPRRWTPTRPAEIVGMQPEGPMFGSPGPDAGYAFLLFDRLSKRLANVAGENPADVKVAITATALRRASRMKRGPTYSDLEWAAAYWGLLESDSSPPSGLNQHDRAVLFAGCAHDFALQRRIAHYPPDGALGG